MNRNLTRIVLVAFAAATIGLVTAPKEASAVSLNLINTWRMGDLGGYASNGTSGYLNNGPAWSQGAFPRMGINIHFGIGLGKGDQIVPFIGFGMQRVSYSLDYNPSNDDNDPEIDNDTGNALQFGLDVGAKFFFIERAKGKAPPFVMLAFYKYIGSIGEDGDYEGPAGASPDGEADTDNAIDFLIRDQQLLSPTGFKIAFGAEYYFNDNFSLGGEFLGVDFAWARATNPNDIDLIDTRTQFSLYTSLHLTYRFSFSVRASVQFESDYDYED
ncbi:MAG: hypothetical protein KDA24_14445 [Deltaproteobacteria bacterium]|nr:hypothetical protein [Deltaproteobacteria bacterium]